jgi:lysozyme family protein
MRTNFDKAVSLLIGNHEKGYANHSWDPGGETIYGISKSAFPSAWHNGPPDYPTCVGIYREEFWEKIKGDLLPWHIAYPVFDAAVMHGITDAVIFLQKTLNVKVDGIIGPITIRIAAQKVDKVGILADYMSRRAVYMSNLPHWSQAGRGWMRRLFLVQQEALSE